MLVIAQEQDDSGPRGQTYRMTHVEAGEGHVFLRADLDGQEKFPHASKGAVCE